MTHYDDWETEARAAQAGPIERYSIGDFRPYIGGQIRMTINLGHGPLPIVMSPDDFQNMLDAGRRLLTAMMQIEEE